MTDTAAVAEAAKENIVAEVAGSEGTPEGPVFTLELNQDQKDIRGSSGQMRNFLSRWNASRQRFDICTQRLGFPTILQWVSLQTNTREIPKFRQ